MSVLQSNGLNWKSFSLSTLNTPSSSWPTFSLCRAAALLPACVHAGVSLCQSSTFAKQKRQLFSWVHWPLGRPLLTHLSLQGQLFSAACVCASILPSSFHNKSALLNITSACVLWRNSPHAAERGTLMTLLSKPKMSPVNFSST